MEAIDNDVEQAAMVISLSGELDGSDGSWADELNAALDAGHDRLVVDLLNVSFIDSSMLRELILAFRRVSPTGWLRLVYTHHLIGRVLEICGLAETFPQFTTLDAALRDAPTQAAAHRLADQAGHGPASRLDSPSRPQLRSVATPPSDAISDARRDDDG